MQMMFRGFRNGVLHRCGRALRGSALIALHSCGKDAARTNAPTIPNLVSGTARPCAQMGSTLKAELRAGVERA